MIALLLILIGAILFVTTGIGRILFSYILIAILEVFAFLFSGFAGLVIVGLLIAFVMASFNKHS